MLTVEDGTGLPNADSYVSVDEADAYHAAHGNLTWAGLEVEQKEILLRRATDYITYIFGPSFIGTRAVAGQALAWPRTSIYDINLYGLGVPRQVREATVELALTANTTPLVPNPSIGLRKKKVKVGSIEVEYDANSYTAPRFVEATMRLAQLMDIRTSNGITARVVRT